MASHNEILVFGPHARIDMPQDCDCRDCETLRSLVNSHSKYVIHDYAFCAENLPFDLAFANAHTRRRHVCTIDKNKDVQWDAWNISSNTNVLIIGSYYNQENIAKLYEITPYVTHYVMSESDLVKFPKAKVFPMSYTSHLWYPSWLYYMYRRETPHATTDDHAFYRGLMHTYSDMSWDQIVRTGVDEMEMVKTGHIVMKHIAKEVSNIVRDQSCDIQCGPYRARMVVNSGPIYVTDIVRAAAEDGYDIGISMRTYKDGYTRFTFYTCKSFVDLSFLHQQPYGAGGNAYKGLTIDRIVSYDASAKSLEQMIFGQDMIY